MRNFRRAVVVLGSLVTGALSCSLFAVGCGDDNGSPSEAGGDATDGQVADITTDVTHDQGSDAPKEGTTEAALDAPADNTVPDARPDSADGAPDVRPDNVDGGPDSGPDAQEAASDANSDALDAGPDYTAQLTFQQNIATAVCQQIALCCFPDGGTSQFDFSFCQTELQHSGYDNSSVGVDFVNRGHIGFDPDAAAQCLTGIGMISNCTLTAALQPQLLTNCFGAYVGLLDAGASCAASIECAAGLVCDTTGTCVPLRTQGQPCGDFADATPDPLGNQFCSHRGSGNTGLQCNEIDNAGNNLAPDAATCLPQIAQTTTPPPFCNYDTDCVSPMICDLQNFNCATSRTLIVTSGTCPGLILTDAGGD